MLGRMVPKSSVDRTFPPYPDIRRQDPQTSSRCCVFWEGCGAAGAFRGLTRRHLEVTFAKQTQDSSCNFVETEDRGQYASWLDPRRSLTLMADRRREEEWARKEKKEEDEEKREGEKEK